LYTGLRDRTRPVAPHQPASLARRALLQGRPPWIAGPICKRGSRVGHRAVALLLQEMAYHHRITAIRRELTHKRRAVALSGEHNECTWRAWRLFSLLSKGETRWTRSPARECATGSPSSRHCSLRLYCCSIRGTIVHRFRHTTIIHTTLTSIISGSARTAARAVVIGTADPLRLACAVRLSKSSSMESGWTCRQEPSGHTLLPTSEITCVP